MIIYIIKENRLESFTLPLEASGNYWITDIYENNKRNLINMEEVNGKWRLTCNYDYDLWVDGEFKDEVIVDLDNFYFLKSHFTNEVICIFCTKIYDGFTKYQVAENSEIFIGKSGNNNIIYNNNLVGDNHLKLSFINHKWNITSLDKTRVTYVNGFPIKSGNIPHGSVVFVMGLKIIPLGDKLLVSNPANSVTTSLPIYDDNIDTDFTIVDDDPNITVYKKSDYFNRAPRFRSKIEKLQMNIDEPPAPIKEDDKPTLMVLGPMMTMSMTSIVTIYMGLSRASSSNSGWIVALPSIIIGVAMLSSMLIWPLIIRKYTNHRKMIDEDKRRDKYELYIQNKRQEIVRHITGQRQILFENHISLNECNEIIINKKPKLWERKPEEDDFLTVRLGLGTVPLDIDIKYPLDKFSIDDDILKQIIQDLVEESHDVTGAPITVSLLEKRITGVVGQYNLTSEFIKGLLLQLITFYSGDILKIVILTNEENSPKWECFKSLQHLWSNDKSDRYFATNTDEIKEVALCLERELATREEMLNNKLENNVDDYKLFDSYYLIVTDDYKSIADYNFIKRVLKAKDNCGFSLLIANDKLSSLPNECTCFMNINEGTSGLIENEITASNQKEFVAEFPTDIDVETCCLILANIPINIETKQKGLPDSYGFLELYNIGKVEQLNAASRWKSNDPTISLAVPIGVDESGEPFKIDLHERFHGPHGLVAGTTGSGKSEWIITFILSMAINYSPEEVSFVLIDYKGGGLALAFENKEMGIRLPHIAGTITNLDVNELNRSLASIEAELKRRQREFNKARDISGESTIDIYKYQKLYRDKVVDKPISHLFIISDEFAELKAQQPEFMDQLVSTARIGRSLGVHLILATQKPSGVVNDQIWSNSRFKVCLKVQDKADSNDMIKTPDAAALKQPGRFYLLVGYNDYFAMGQSAYCGLKYYPSEKIIKKIDTSLSFINNVGNVVKSVDEIKKNDTTKDHGEVLSNVVEYLTNIAAKKNVQAKKLWLERIPKIIYLYDLIKKYTYTKQNFNINPIIGEYDNPANQSQHLLTLPLSDKGNTIIYGMVGSGKEDLLSTLIYSCCITYSPEELNMYVVDCGSETMKVFNGMPQVGEVLFATDKEKVIRLINMINDIIDERKKLFVEYNGDINFYNKYSRDKQPYIVVIINNFENFIESFSELEENLIKLTREGGKYGIIFVTTSSSSSSIRLKLRQNFNQSLTLQLIDPYDYSAIFGNMNRIVPASYKGRGLVKLDDIYEFQTASICEPDKIMEQVKVLRTKLNSTYTKKARKIPSMPEVIDINYLKDEISTLDKVPIGVSKANLDIAKFDIKSNYISVIASTSINNTKNFINGLLPVFKGIKNTKLMVFDLFKIVNSDITDGMLYSNKSFEDYLLQLTTFLERSVNEYTRNNYDSSSLEKYGNLLVFIVGLDELFNRISPETKQKFTDLINSSKSLNIVNYIFVDTNDNLKKYQYEEWYKSGVKSNYGIWIGNGFADQNSIKLINISRSFYLPIGNEYGYIVKEGIPDLVKLVTIEQDDIETLDF